MRESSPKYGDADGGPDDRVRFRFRGDPPFTDEEVERLDELKAEDEATILKFAGKTTAPEVEKLVRRRRRLDRPSEAEGERR